MFEFVKQFGLFEGLVRCEWCQDSFKMKDHDPRFCPIRFFAQEKELQDLKNENIVLRNENER